jgi:hypothetical protein
MKARRLTNAFLAAANWSPFLLGLPFLLLFMASIGYRFFAGTWNAVDAIAILFWALVFMFLPALILKSSNSPLGYNSLNYSSEEMVCLDCGFIGLLRKTHRGSYIVSLLLSWLFFVPGIVYLFWCLSSRAYHCPTCSGKTIPCSSPMGKKLLEKNRSG